MSIPIPTDRARGPISKLLQGLSANIGVGGPVNVAGARSPSDS